MIGADSPQFFSAEVEPPPSQYSWAPFTFRWVAERVNTPS